MTTFWLLAPVMVVAALGLVFAKKAVHAALCLAIVMISLAVLYAAQGAPFLFVVQIIVYTGAIMMLFLFVLMLVGVESSDAVKETIKGQRFLAAAIGLIFGITAGRQQQRQPIRSGRAPVRQVRPCLRVHQRTADHRRARCDGACAQ